MARKEREREDDWLRRKVCDRRCASHRAKATHAANGAQRTARHLAGFWANIDTSGGPRACWPWQGATSFGYGIFNIYDRKVHAHRLAKELATGALVPKHLVVMHKCDNRPCCNPEHLEVGTQRDNLMDCIAKGRHRVRAKLTRDEVLEIRRLADTGIPRCEIAPRFRVTATAVSQIVLRKTWSHV